MTALDEADRRQLARGIFDELEPLLAAAFASASWGRLLVFVADTPNGVRVRDLQVEEILDEDAVEQAFESVEARSALPSLATAVVALSQLHDTDATLLGGGTFVRGDDAMHFLPGTVRTPSRGFDSRRDPVVADAQARLRAADPVLGLDGASEIVADMEEGTIEVKRDGRTIARGLQVPIGSFLTERRSWVWAAHNPSLPERSRSAAKRLVDRFKDRSLWEISTPGFTTDASSAFALGAMVAIEAGFDYAIEVPNADGFVILGLRTVAAVAGAPSGEGLRRDR